MSDDQARKLVTVQKIAEIASISGADKIEAARINGWWSVVKKDEFNVGDLVLYAEVDSWIPNIVAPFLSGSKEPREYKGIKGERLRTVRLRGQLSQGLILPLSVAIQGAERLGPVEVGFDVTDRIGVIKWERDEPIRGLARGSFPSFLRKTDQERIQNIPGVLLNRDTEYEATLKLDGSSITVYVNDGVAGVCSRNLDLKMTDANAFVSTANAQGMTGAILEYYDSTGRSIAIQGELMGPGIQGNREGLRSHEIFPFDVWDIDNQRYLSVAERAEILSELEGIADRSWRVAPCIAISTLEEMGIDSVVAALEYADRSSLNHAIAEGVVFKSTCGTNSFKVINNRFLLRGGD